MSCTAIGDGGSMVQSRLVLWRCVWSNINIVDTPDFVSSYGLQPVVNDSDLLSGRDFAPLTHRRHRIS